MDEKENITHRCGECKGYNANYCHTYDEITHPDSEVRDALFESLMEPENRRIEPWTATLLGYLNHHLRQEEAVKYIYRGLEEMEEVQRTGDIFFPRNWAGALLAGHRSKEAYDILQRFLDENPDYPTLMRNKILQAAYPLQRHNR